MGSSDADRDPLVRELREEIAANDLALLEALNRRLELVRRLKAHKDSQGLPFVDRAQEQRLLDRLATANKGPLSEAAVRDLYGLLLDLTKREV
jgi:chorismate mutase